MCTQRVLGLSGTLLTIFQCSANPVITFQFGGVGYNVTSSDFNIGQVSSGLGSNGGTNPFGGSSPGTGRSGSSSSTQMCIGALFDAGTSGSTTAPSWIVRDSACAIKLTCADWRRVPHRASSSALCFADQVQNVYAVFRSSPAAVGFANLAYSVETSTQEASLTAAGSTNVSSTTVNGSNNAKSAAAGSAQPFGPIVAWIAAALFYVLA